MDYLSVDFPIRCCLLLMKACTGPFGVFEKPFQSHAAGLEVAVM